MMIILLRSAKNEESACMYIYTSRIGVVNCDIKTLQRTRVISWNKGGCQSQNGHNYNFHHIWGSLLLCSILRILAWVRDGKHCIWECLFIDRSHWSSPHFCINEAYNLVILQLLSFFFFLWLNHSLTTTCRALNSLKTYQMGPLQCHCAVLMLLCSNRIPSKIMFLWPTHK